MVDVSAKPATRREAVAEAFVELSREGSLRVAEANPKRDPLEHRALRRHPGRKEDPPESLYSHVPLRCRSVLSMWR